MNYALTDGLRRRGVDCWVGVVLISLFLFCGTATVTAQQADTSQSSYEEIFLTFRYRNAVDKVITARMYGNTVYYPLSVLLDNLAINHQIDLSKRIVKGTYLNQATPYTIDFKSGKAKIGRKTVNLGKQDFQIGNIHIFVSSSFLNKVWGWNVNLDMSDLTFRITSSQDLPIVALSEVQASTADVASARLNYAPLLYKRPKNLFKLGVLDYYLNYIYSNKSSVATYNTVLGSDIAGGELTGGVQGALNSTGATLYPNNIQWRYVFDNSSLLSQFVTGDLSSQGLSSQNIVGARITNQPPNTREFYTVYTYRGQTKPNWKVELYLNNHLVGSTIADQTGNFVFKIPLSYGTTTLDFKYFGPNGEIDETQKRFQIPYTFEPKGVLGYTIEAGELKYGQLGLVNRGDRVAQGNMSLGITKWLTQKIGADYLNKPVPYSSTSFRLGSSYMFDFTAAPKTLYRASMNIVYPSQTSFDLNYSRYYGLSLYNTNNLKDQFTGDGFIPFRFGKVPFNIQMNGGFQHIRNTLLYTYKFGFNTTFLGTNFNANIQRIGTYNYLNGTALATFPNAKGILRGMLIRGAYSYNLSFHTTDHIDFTISKAIGSFARMEFSLHKDFIQGFYSAGLRLTMILPSIYSITSADHRSNQNVYAENIRGSLSMDNHDGRLIPGYRQWNGLSAASFLMYEDKNENGKYDKGEHIIKDAKVRFTQAVPVSSSNDGIIRAENLQAYTRYNVAIDMTSIKNPFDIPIHDKFSFITNPDVFTRVDVPFYKTGILTGSVMLKKKKKLVPVSDVNLNIRSLENDTSRDKISTFSDGTFYDIGLLPGSYKISVDSTQLAMLNAKSVPAYRIFKIDTTNSGKEISGNDFVINIMHKAPETVSIPPVKQIPTILLASTYKLPEPFPGFKPDTCNYYMLIGRYRWFKNFAAAIYRFSHSLNYTLIPRYDSTNMKYELYALLGKDRREAHADFVYLQNHEYQGKFIFLKRCTPIKDNLTYTLQFGAFRSGRKAALAYMTSIEKKIHEKIHLYRDKKRRLFLLQIRHLNRHSLESLKNKALAMGVKSVYILINHNK